MNSFGRLFRVSIWGESHGEMTGVLLDGCPPGIPLTIDDFAADLARRRPKAPGTTARIEADIPALRSGILNGKTTGAPVLISFDNRDVKSNDYDEIAHKPRPGHADLTARQKYKGFNDPRGGGHLSGRITVGVVAAGVIAKKILGASYDFQATVLEAGGSKAPEQAAAEAASVGDSVGALIECRVEGAPPGLGEPFFDGYESCLAHLLFAIPGIKGVEFGAGFAVSKMKGSDYNDPILDDSGRTATNNAGGINGGITNGNPIVFRVAARPSASISKTQETIDLRTGRPCKLEVHGRHDACFGLRLPVIVEAAAAVVSADFKLVAKRAY